MARSTVARANLKEQALLSYLAGGAPTDHPAARTGRGSDPSLTVSYAEIVSGGQRRAVDAYRAVLASQTSQSKQLTAADRQALATLSELQTDRTAATQALAARQQTLAQVQGQLATLVAQVQEAQQQAEQAAVAGQPGPPGPARRQPPAVQPVRPRARPRRTARRRPAPRRAPLVSPVTARRRTDDAAPRRRRRRRPGPTPPTASPPGRTRRRPPRRRPRRHRATTPTATAATDDRTTGHRPRRHPPPPSNVGGSPAPGDSRSSYAYAQLGKPYQWGGAGPDSFDCSGLTMMAWEHGRRVPPPPGPGPVRPDDAGSRWRTRCPAT